MKKLISLLLTAILCVSALPSALAEAPTLSLAALRTETADGWRQTYESHGRSIRVTPKVISW